MKKYFYILIVIIVLIIIFGKNNNLLPEKTNQNNEKATNSQALINNEIEEKTNPYYDSFANKIINSEKTMKIVNVIKDNYECKDMRNLNTLDLEMLTGITTNLYDEVYAEVNEDEFLIVLKTTIDEILNNKLSLKLILFKDDLFNKYYNNENISKKINDVKINKIKNYFIFFNLKNNKNNTTESEVINKIKNID